MSHQLKHAHAHQVKDGDSSMQDANGGYRTGHGQHEGHGGAHPSRQHQVQRVTLQLLRLTGITGITNYCILISSTRAEHITLRSVSIL